LRARNFAPRVFVGDDGGKETRLILSDRLRALREEKHLTQGDIEKRTGLARSYISRVENGHTVPVIETLEKMAGALEVPMYQLFYDGEEPPKLSNPLKYASAGNIAWGSTGKEDCFLSKFRGVLGRMDEENRKLILSLALKMVGPRAPRTRVSE
jgi:transcriptional regulator with XRE-family HTH domain